jgi:uncharacterized glyoxalase superfamily protein PhnB
MNLKILFQITITEKITACLDFYTKLFDFQVVFENDWYVHLKDVSGIELAFMKLVLENQPEFIKGSYAQSGVIYSLEVFDAKSECERLKALKVEFVLELKHEEQWGQIHFMLKDPSVMVIDVVEQLV